MTDRVENTFDIPIGTTLKDVNGVLYIMIGWAANTMGRFTVFHTEIRGRYNDYTYHCVFAETLVAKFPDVERFKKNERAANPPSGG